MDGVALYNIRLNSLEPCERKRGLFHTCLRENMLDFAVAFLRFLRSGFRKISHSNFSIENETSAANAKRQSDRSAPSTRTRPSDPMLHCVSFFSAGFNLAGPTSHVKLYSAAVPLSRSSVPFAAAAAAENVDEVELRFRDLEVTKERAPEVLALMEEHSFPLGLAQRAVES